MKMEEDEISHLMPRSQERSFNKCIFESQICFVSIWPSEIPETVDGRPRYGVEAINSNDSDTMWVTQEGIDSPVSETTTYQPTSTDTPMTSHSATS